MNAARRVAVCQGLCSTALTLLALGCGQSFTSTDGSTPDAGSAADGAAATDAGPVDFDAGPGAIRCTSPRDCFGMATPMRCEFRPGVCAPGVCVPGACTRDIAQFALCDGTCGSGSGNCPPAPYLSAGCATERPCGGRAGDTCSPTEFCDYPDGALCGADDSQGVCRARPGACPPVIDPVCGCDGRDYASPCDAQVAGSDAATRGMCANPAPVSCDARQVACLAPTPLCMAGMVPSVSGACWGPCVRIDACTCSAPEQCPQPERYTCLTSLGRCSPFIR